MRVFLALELPGTIKEYLLTVTKTMSQKVSGVKWVKAEGLHVTLKFFGEIEEKKVQEIGEALQGINKQHTGNARAIKGDKRLSRFDASQGYRCHISGRG